MNIEGVELIDPDTSAESLVFHLKNGDVVVWYKRTDGKWWATSRTGNYQNEWVICSAMAHLIVSLHIEAGGTPPDHVGVTLVRDHDDKEVQLALF